MKRGDVILCKFPHSGTAPAKVRPALVVQSDYYNDRIVNLLVAGITGTLVNSSDPAHFVIDLSTPEGRQSGLKRNSLVSSINLAVIPRRNVDRRTVRFGDEANRRVPQSRTGNAMRTRKG